MIHRTMLSKIRRQRQRRCGMFITMIIILLINQLHTGTLEQAQSNKYNFFLTMVHAAPYVLLQNKAPYCFSAEFMIQPHATYTIDFHAPDMIVIDEIEDNSNNNNNENKDNLSYNNIIPPVSRSGDPAAAAAIDAINQHQQAIVDRGLDIRYQERQQKRYDILKRSNMKDVIITITPRDMNGVMVAPNMMKKKNIPESEIPIKYRHPLEQRKGTFTYYTGALNGGSLEICIQSYTANVENPSRVAIRIENMSDQMEIESALQRERQMLLEQQQQVLEEQQLKEQRLVVGESSRISAELMRLYRRARGLNEDAEYTKESEAQFFTNTRSLNKAIRNWYLVRFFVLIITGYLQASYIMKHMKSRGTYW